MTDIFISYVRETEAEAQRIVEALRGNLSDTFARLEDLS